jgi:hypothetical protein
MAELLLPAGSYEEALPDLRAPYQPSQIRPLIIAVPKNEKAPCKIALYTIGETLMDRFNLVCGASWERPKFTIDIHDEREELTDEDRKKVLHYFKITCTLTVFGKEHEDFGEGESENPALAEYDARAQAFKRAARWHGPGQCLYVFGGEEVIMWRGAGAGKLQVPKSGTEPHRRPYFDKQGRNAIRDEYARWLRDDGEALFGAPLDHLKIAHEIKARMTARLAAIPAPATQQLAIVEPPPSSTPTGQDTDGEDHGPEQPPAGEPSQRVTGAMPDEPASVAAIQAAQDSGYSEQVAKALSNLAATQDQSGPLSDPQERVVRNWLIALARFEVSEAKVLDAVALAARVCDCQEARQAQLAKWLSAKAQENHGSTPDAESSAAKAPTPEGVRQASAETSLTHEPQSTAAQSTQQSETADTEQESQDLATARAYVRIHRAMDAHAYDDQAVTRLAALAVGAGPRGHVDWAKVPADVLEIISELLEAAGSLGWSTETLNREVLRAHERTQQGTSAGRFAAFANHLMNAAETRAAQAA